MDREGIDAVLTERLARSSPASAASAVAVNA
jgi:hypothetical protein